MLLTKWEDKYDVGITEIDGQHRHWVDIINKLQHSIDISDTDDIVDEILDELISYTSHHFSTEEDYFKKLNYVEAEKHCSLHQKFLTDLLSFIDKFHAGKEEISEDILLWMKDWFFHHITEDDQKFISYFKK